ncbi:MAG: hypothetical protein D8M52_05135 [Chlorobi bacterium]|nr:MAG: hypothetical protein F9K28_11500 [Bacteroidota bacterium]MBL1161086.1 hypothetical protein [Chlorobiota bacterium]MBW7854258.1 hypothetical protein [Candidatus Kapabacteria bacterium]MCL4277974.1 hypothetical protein [Ignavibacteria bacterium]NOG67554.1 hypothetical protein [Chlorobiota bacterium]
MCSRSASYLLLTILLAVGTATAQRVVTSGIMLHNGSSIVEIRNPNTSGNFVLKLPEIPTLAPGQQMVLQLMAQGTDTGTVLSYDVPATSQTLSSADASVSPTSSQPAPSVIHALTELDLPVIEPTGSFIARVAVPGIRAGAAITVSPAGEMNSTLHPAYAWAPIDCVVMIKFMNSGNAPQDLEPMQFAVGGINP